MEPAQESCDVGGLASWVGKLSEIVQSQNRTIAAQSQLISSLEKRVASLEAASNTARDRWRAPERGTWIDGDAGSASNPLDDIFRPRGEPLLALGTERPLDSLPQSLFPGGSNGVVGERFSAASMDAASRDDVTALESEDLYRLVESCALEFIRSNPTLRQGAWCTDCEGPCTSTGAAESNAVQSGVDLADGGGAGALDTDTLVMVNGEPVKVAELLPNSAVEYLVRHPGKSGRWCRGHPETLSATTCTFVHRKFDENRASCGGDGKVPNADVHGDIGEVLMVEGTPVPVSALVRNQAVEVLLSHPVSREGQWCNSDDATHDVTICYRIHRRQAPQDEPTASHSCCSGSCNHEACSAVRASAAADADFVLVSGAKIQTADLLQNPALDFLSKNPGKNGRWCRATKEHDATACNFVHPKVGGEASAECERAKNRPVPPDVAASDESAAAGACTSNAVCVKVGSDVVPVDRLALNPAVEYLLAHPNRRGRWCQGHGTKKIQECTFVHTNSEISPTATGSDNAMPAAASEEPAPRETLRTRMVVYYHGEDRPLP